MHPFLTKLEVARILVRPLPFKNPENAALKLARLSNIDFQLKIHQYGMVIENFGYNRYIIK